MQTYHYSFWSPPSSIFPLLRANLTSFLPVCLPVLAAGSGMMLSCYLYHVETNIEQSPRYAPACDINSVITCSTVANSRFSKLLFGCPNSLVAILFYFSLIGLSLSFELAPDSYWILLLTSVRESSILKSIQPPGP